MNDVRVGVVRGSGRSARRGLVVLSVGLLTALTFVLPSGSAAEPLRATSAAAPAGSWTVAKTQLPPRLSTGVEAAVTGVDCWAAGRCATAGTYQGKHGTVGVLTTNGPKQTTVVAPLPGDAADDPQLQLGAVYCWGGGLCVAVGSYRTVAWDARPLVETLSGGRWRAGAPNLPASSGPADSVQLDQVACSKQQCVAIGSYEEFAPDLRPLILVRAAGTPSAAWRPVTITAASSPVTVGGVACAPSGGCAAFGSVAGRASIFTPSSGGWQGRYAPAPDGIDPAGLDLTSMSCPSATSCVVLGSYGSGAGRGLTVVRMRGGALTAVRLALPTSAEGRDLHTGGLSCASASACAGVASASGGPGATLVLTSSGDVWSVRRVALPSSAPARASSFLQDVSCSDVDQCVAVGGFDRTTYQRRTLQRPLVVTWNGTRWTTEGLATPAGPPLMVGDALYQLACRGDRCLAAGTFEQYSQAGALRDSGAFLASRV